MDGTRMRRMALACPLALGALLGVAAFLEPVAAPPGTRPGAEQVPASTRGVAVTATVLIDQPHTTPPPQPLPQARPGEAPVPAPVPARTAGDR